MTNVVVSEKIFLSEILKLQRSCHFQIFLQGSTKLNPMQKFAMQKFAMQTLLVRLRRTNGDGEIRTLDPLLARQVLSQLSYAPKVCFRKLRFRTAIREEPNC